MNRLHDRHGCYYISRPRVAHDPSEEAMSPSISGIHHVTAIADAPQPNVDFYVGVLGLRMVKLTVNFDDPGTYHLYYGDEVGRPGSVMTFFPWAGAAPGSRGTGQATVTSFSVAAGSTDFWRERLGRHRITLEGPVDRLGETVLSLHDPDGLVLEIVASEAERRAATWEGGPVPPEHSIRGFHGVTLSETNLDRTAALLVETLGFRRVAESGNRFRYEVGDGGPGARVDILHLPGLARGLVSVGTVHHVAFRTPDDAQQVAWQGEIRRRGIQVTPVADRHYFHSIYFREPGGVLFEIATDVPGFTIDEARDRLGARLMLPPWLEPRRAQLMQHLSPIRLPAA